ncbi:hypothetical protein LCGC14_1359030 [marine sediment metagenome]|uniref:Uncharacterized protein n=1 Tax=marine sediment metagenome TaxID=412755 RepID=A0A0F9K981_9ZZZZ
MKATFLVLVTIIGLAVVLFLVTSLGRVDVAEAEDPEPTPTPFMAEHCEMSDRVPNAPDCPTSTPTPTPTPSSPTPIASSISQAPQPLTLPLTGGEPSEEDLCRDWTTGQAGDVVRPCPDDGKDYLATVGILLASMGLVFLTGWALFRGFGKP